MTPEYLAPYERARRRGVAGVRSLLWADRQAQEVRFDALIRNCPLAGRHVLDVGCGPADLLAYLRARGLWPSFYTGVEAQPWLAAEARARRYSRCVIREGDFVQQPSLLRAGAEVVVFSGSLNLLDSRDFYRVLRAAWESSSEALVFNFLCSPTLAGAAWLYWHQRGAVLRFASSLAGSVRLDADYEPGDCTVVMRKRPATRS